MEIDYKEAIELLAYNYGKLEKENERLEKDSYVLNDLIEWLDEMIKMSNVKPITIVLESVRSKINTLELLENVKTIDKNDKKTTQLFDKNDKKVNLTSKSIEKDKVLEVNCKESGNTNE